MSLAPAPPRDGPGMQCRERRQRNLETPIAVENGRPAAGPLALDSADPEIWNMGARSWPPHEQLLSPRCAGVERFRASLSVSSGARCRSTSRRRRRADRKPVTVNKHFPPRSGCLHRQRKAAMGRCVFRQVGEGAVRPNLRRRALTARDAAADVVEDLWQNRCRWRGFEPRIPGASGSGRRALKQSFGKSARGNEADPDRFIARAPRRGSPVRRTGPVPAWG